MKTKNLKNDILPVLGLDSGYPVKYNHPAEGYIRPYIPRLALMRLQYDKYPTVGCFGWDQKES